MFSDAFWREEKQKNCSALASTWDCSGVCTTCNLSTMYTYTQMHIYFLSALLRWWYLWNTSVFSCCFAVLAPSAQSCAVAHHGSELCKSRGKEAPSSVVYKQWHILLSNPISHWLAYSRLPPQSWKSFSQKSAEKTRLTCRYWSQ